MADNELGIVELRDEFYRDSMPLVMLIIISVSAAIALLAATSLYLYFKKPAPLAFGVESEWRVQSDISLDRPYISIPEVLQWTSDTLRKILVFDFVNYNDQVQAASPYFTSEGWRVYLNQLNNIANQDDVINNKVFINGVPSGAPFILNQGQLSGRYAWWVQMPVDLNTVKGGHSSTQTITLQILVVRVSTLNNLSGVQIDNIIVAKGAMR